MPKPHAKVIVNPVAGANSTRKRWPIISRLLKRIGLSFDHEFTEGKGHAIELARIAADNGYGYLVAVGGDGTINEVANGILNSTQANHTSLGVVSTGTGGDFIRSVGIPRDFASACSCLSSPRRLPIDVGIVEYTRNGKPARRYFVNAAGVGFDATVVEATERFPKYFGGTIPYVLGMLRSWLAYRNKSVVLGIGDSTRKARILNAVIANGVYFGGGMRVAPEAVVNDGLFDIVIIGDIGKIELLKAFPLVYKGTHLTHPKASLDRTNHFTIESSGPILVHADGELLGEGPATFRLMPSALNIVV